MDQLMIMKLVKPNQYVKVPILANTNKGMMPTNAIVLPIAQNTTPIAPTNANINASSTIFTISLLLLNC